MDADAVRDVRYHSAKNRRKRQDKRDAFAAKRAYLGRTPSDVLHPPSSKLYARAVTFKPDAFLRNIERRSTPAGMRRQIAAMQQQRQALTFHACLRMLQRGIAVRDLGSPLVEVVYGTVGYKKIVTVYRRDSQRNLDRLRRTYGRLKPNKAQLRAHGLETKPARLSDAACRDVLASRIKLKRLFHKKKKHAIQVNGDAIVGIAKR